MAGPEDEDQVPGLLPGSTPMQPGQPEQPPFLPPGVEVAPPAAQEQWSMDDHVGMLTGQGPPGPQVSNPGSWQEMLVGPLVAPPSMGGGGQYTVDPEQASQAIADLRHAAEILDEEVRRAEDLANYPPPGLDAVSVEAVRVISEAAIGEQGSLRAALRGAANEFRRQAEKLEADLRAYLQVEELNIPKATPMEQL